jgi:exopolysaccharide production protein ExoQ
MSHAGFDRPPGLMSSVRRPGGVPSRSVLSPGMSRLLILRMATVANVVVSMSNFHEALLPPSLSSLQQYAGIALWLVTIWVALGMKPVLELRVSTDAWAIVIFYGFAITSVLWSDLSISSIMKAAALFVTSTGAFMLATRLDLQDIIFDVNIGLLVLTVASIVVVVMLPDIGVSQDWSHEGNWQGVFVSKQSLGVLGGIAMFFSAYLWLTRGRSWLFAVSFLLAAACAFGSESRGGGALALLACVCVFFAGRSRGVAKALGFAPFAILLAATTMIAYLYATGEDAFDISGTRIDFTERTFIWQYALAHFDERPILGFGINGFWTNGDFYRAFERSHGWVLDDFHSGYVAILTETGLVGYAAFAVCTLLFGVRLTVSIEEGTMARARVVALIGFMTLIYMIDLTETIFLRSTSFMSTLIPAFLVNSAMPTARREASS